MRTRMILALMISVMVMQMAPLTEATHDNTVSAWTAVDRVPDGFTPIYDVSDLMTVGAGGSRTGSDGNVYDWDLSSSYILMNNIRLTAPDPDVEITVTRSGGSMTLTFASTSGTSTFEGTVWLGGHTADIVDNKAVLPDIDGNILTEGTKDSVLFTHSFVPDGDTVTFSTTGNFDPIGGSSSFTGIFNGNGKTISGMEIRKRSATSVNMFVGMFAALNNAKVYNLIIDDAEVSAILKAASGGIYAGILTGIVNGNTSIEKCTVEGNITVFRHYSGYSYVTTYAGGMIGSVNPGAGAHTSISDCAYSGNAASGMTVATVYTGTTHMGGIAGYGTNMSVTGCVNNGNIMPTAMADKTGSTVITNAGGIAGYASRSEISDCGNTGRIMPVGISDGKNSVAGAYAGGIAGYGNDCAIAGCNNTGSIMPMSTGHGNGSGADAVAGGVAAKTHGSNVSRCGNTGEIFAEATSAYGYANAVAGGTAGAFEADYFASTYQQNSMLYCYNTAEISAKADAAHPTAKAGGMAGNANGAFRIVSCYNTGGISADAGTDGAPHAGGLVGSAGYGEAYIAYSYNAGPVNADTGDGYAGALAGYLGSGVRSEHLVSLDAVAAALFGGPMSHENDSGSSFRTIEEMRSAETYEWPSFTLIWSISADDNNGLPRFAERSFEQYVILLNTGGGEEMGPITADQGTFLSIPVPGREGYVFRGWYTGPDGTGERKDSLYVMSNMTLYAHWSSPQTTSSGVDTVVCLLTVVSAILFVTMAAGLYVRGRMRNNTGRR